MNNLAFCCVMKMLLIPLNEFLAYLNIFKHLMALKLTDYDLFPIILPLFSIGKTKLGHFLKNTELKCVEKNFEHSPNVI